MSEKVLVVGNGGREHAIVWKLVQSKQVKQVYVTNGTIGMCHAKVECIAISTSNAVLTLWCQTNCINLVVVGPEAPLAEGIADALNAAGINCFGPSQSAAKIETDKEWAKGFFDRHSIPTARWSSFTDSSKAKHFIKSSEFPALVVKASGLAAGKGVVVAVNSQEACDAVDSILTEKKFGNAGQVIVVEELLEGEEVSVLCFSDGTSIKVMLPAQDHKRHLDNDLGANTGGMGAYCPCPLLSSSALAEVEKNILQRTIDGLRAEGVPFVGVLYAGLMMTRDGPKVLEFNCRFGDPETQVILPLLQSDLYQVMSACCKGTLSGETLQWHEGTHSVGVVMASRGYPESSSKGDIITGLDTIPDNLLIFHSAVTKRDDQLVTNGGRVLIVVSLSTELRLAAQEATIACSSINFTGSQYRHDIARKGIARAILLSGVLTYKASGVDITAGDTLVSNIKPLVKGTDRSGIMGSIGGFGGLFDVKAAGYEDPLLVSGTDGVGTKLKIAQECGMHSTIGIDLVAMCVNDILAHGAEPLFFLDYFACGKLDVSLATQIVSGVAIGCQQANCSLIGGETAEMPGIYLDGDYDLAGFAVGAVERKKLIPMTSKIIPGDVVIGLSSSGVHSNGFSLVRKVVEMSGVNYSDIAPFSDSGKSYGEELLTPTKIYVKSLLPSLGSGKVKAFAHITGGGLTENIPRILPQNLDCHLTVGTWPIQPLFGWLAASGGINQSEMLRTFNCGLGAVLLVGKDDVDHVLSMITEKAYIVGSIQKRSQEGPRVHAQGFMEIMSPLMSPYIPKLATLKPTAVLISGSGTNLQALIDADTALTGAKIVLVISNKEGVEGLKRAERANIPTKVIKHNAYPKRVDFDMAVDQCLKDAGVEIVCLAGFMRVLTAEFVAQWRGRLINIHPALLPSFKGTHAVKQALEAGVRITGCTAHFVEPEVDAGAILVQESLHIKTEDDEESLQDRIKHLEHRVFPKALSLVAKGKVCLSKQNKLIWN